MTVRLRRSLLITVACLIASVGLPRGASATVLVAADLGELVASARTVVHGRVIEAVPQWREGRRGIETVVTLHVEDALKGPAAAAVTFRVPGGQMGPYRSFMPGTPAFREGEDVIVFLGGDGPAIPHLVGFSQGVYRVLTSDAGMRVVRPGVPGPAADSSVKSTRGTVGPALGLDAFETQVRSLARSDAAASRGRSERDAR